MTKNSTDTTDVLLDYSHLIDPIKLLHSLILFRHHRDSVFVAEENLVVEIETPAKRFIDGEWIDSRHHELFNLLDNSLLEYLAHELNINDPSLASTKLPLAIRLLQHSVREGHIQLLSPVKDVRIPRKLNHFAKIQK